MNGSATGRVPLGRVWLLRVALVAVVLGAWFYATTAGHVAPFILPNIGTVAQNIGELVRTGEFWAATGVTISEIAIAAVSSVVIGLVVGFLCSRNERSAATLEPLFAWGYIFPMELLFPLFIVWFGVGVESKIIYAVASSVFPIAYNTIRGLRYVDVRYLEIARAFRASPLQADRHIKLGAAWPVILSGLRIGISMVAISVILAEILGANAGLGFEIQQAINTLQVAKAYAYIVVVIVVSAIFMLFSERLLRERRRGEA